jgi:hypothetical protein
MSVLIGLDAVLRHEDAEFGGLFGIDDARGKQSRFRALCEVLQLEHRRGKGWFL